ncbi:hypothetical protein [uncultured Corynebacterium sp.]|uniref:hypothetical protein n=1 Tax=uncultured Corynebacterium sp. TaxID=159447 RepID=UPI002611E42C|nr:hypothetical protein [uncultured Corynebacterium sp.]
MKIVNECWEPIVKMPFISRNNKKFKLAALASVGVLAVTGLSACGNDDGSDEPNFGQKASDSDGGMSIEEAYDVYDNAYEEGDPNRWCVLQNLAISIGEYDESNIHYLTPNAKHVAESMVDKYGREGCAHALIVANKRNQQTGEAYMSMKYSLLTKDINNTDYVKKYAKKIYPDADVDLAFEELHEDKDKVFERVDEKAFDQAAKLYKMSITPARLDEALRTYNVDTDGDVAVPGSYPYELSADQYRKAFDEAGVDMSDFAAYVIASEIDERLSAAIDSEKSSHHPFDVDIHETYYLSEPPAEWMDRLVGEFKFTESEARSGAEYALDYAANREGRQPHLLVPYLFSKYVSGPDHTPETATLPNGEKAEFTEDVYNKAEVVGDLSDWEQGYLPAGVTNREAKEKYSEEQIRQWQEDGTPLD